MFTPPVDPKSTGSSARPSPTLSTDGHGSIVGAALVVGGGVAGMQAALDLANAGIRVYLVDSAPAIGGTAAQLDKIFPTNDCSMCMLSPRLAECSRHLNIEIITGAELLDLEGEPGCFTARVRQQARYVELDKCTACGDCVPVCPVRRPDDFNGGLADRRAIYKLYPQGTPNAFAVERTSTPPCHQACPAGVRGSAIAALIRENRLEDARLLLLKDNPFPGICTYLCVRSCESVCPRSQVDQPVALAKLMGFLAELPREPATIGTPSTRQRVAVIGSGPAELTASADLARLGYAVTVFETGSVAGGGLRTLYPEEAIAGGVLDSELAVVASLGIEIRTNQSAYRPCEFLDDGYQAVLVSSYRQTSPLSEAQSVQSAVFVVEPASTAPDSIGAGHRAARSISAFLRGEPDDRSSSGELPTTQISAAAVGRMLSTGLASRRPRSVTQGALGNAEGAIAEAERCLACGGCADCGECVRVCQANAVNLNMQDREFELTVGAVILAMGIQPFDPKTKGEYGFGRYSNVITSLQFERMLSASGPSGGQIYRPSDGRLPQRIAFIQCVGSRDIACGRGYCSEICCMFVAEEAIIAREHAPEVQPTVFYLDLRATGKGFERHVEAARRQHGVRYVRSMVSTVREVPGTQNLRIRYVDENGKQTEEEFDLVILAMGLGTPDSAQELCRHLGVDLDAYGFPRLTGPSPVATSRDGVFAAGCLAGPKDISAAAIQGSAAAAAVARMLAPARGSLAQTKEYPPERDVTDEPTRIGVFICRCGINIGGVVDVPVVVASARQLPDVAHAEENLYTCSVDTLRGIRTKVVELGLNRVVVAACTPRTHEPLYQETIREAGLSPFLFEMVNIREQDSWVHRAEPELATRKAQDLVAMAVARARFLRPIARQRFDIVAEALVIGGGLAGMTAALALADQGFRTCLVEKEPVLGGQLRHIHIALGEVQPPELLRSLSERTTSHPDINLYTEAVVRKIDGRVGRFSSVLQLGGSDLTGDEAFDANRQVVVAHGALIVAVGAQCAQPAEYLYGQDDRVVTQTELENNLADARPDLSKYGRGVAMIQCVGSRTDGQPYCSKVCCLQAIKNSLVLKVLAPSLDVYVLYRDMRTGGVQEDNYRLAREAGIQFLRYDVDRPPRVVPTEDGLVLTVEIPGRRGAIDLNVDLLVLSTGIAPGHHEKLAACLRLPLTEDGFFLEAHPKLRPIDFAAEGMFVCGLAHSPQTIPDTIAQAEGAAARAATLLSREALESTGVVAVVDERRCAGCGLCILVCPYDARRIDEETGVALVDEILCQGCGACSAACPNGAARQLTLERQQVVSMLEVL